MILVKLVVTGLIKNLDLDTMDTKVLTKEDIIEIIKYLIELSIQKLMLMILTTLVTEGFEPLVNS
jgi:hypothetical protein